MDNKINRKKQIIFISLTFCFFLGMLFLFLNISSLMYNNSAVLLAIKEANNLKTIIENNYNFNGRKSSLEESRKIDALISKLEYFPELYHLKVYSPEKRILYQWGPDIILKNEINMRKVTAVNGNFYSKTVTRQKEVPVYEIVIPLTRAGEHRGYLNLLFNLSTVEKKLFGEKSILFMIVFMFNFIIVFFLVIMILNLQKRLHNAQREIESISVNDKVTGLLTKEAFLNLMRKEVERIERKGGQIAVLTLDIDNFYTINKKFGRDFGDQVLRTVSHIITTNYRSFDFVGRLGGDEIIILMIDSTEEEGYNAAERCRKKIEESKFYCKRKEITITVSIGLASSEHIPRLKLSLPERGKNYFRALLFNSLNALARSKRNKKNCTTKYSEM